MKKIFLFLFATIVFYSCVNTDNDPKFKYELIKIDKATTPASFTFGKTDSIKIEYTFPNGCYSFKKVNYKYQDTARIVAVTALISLQENCILSTQEEEYTFLVTATQREDYLFKFWKGKDNDGNNLFEEVVIPVN